jgi:hypothetical protein
MGIPADLPEMEKNEDGMWIKSPLLFNFVMHVERETEYTDRSFAEGMMDLIRNIVDNIETNDAALNLQSDFTFLEGTRDFRPDFVNDVESRRDMRVDPHAHEVAAGGGRSPNFTDVAKILEDLRGDTPSHVMGGFTWNEPSDLGYWYEDYRRDVAGVENPTYNWRSNILWGATEMTPSGDKNPLAAFGAWRPRGHASLADFTTFSDRTQVYMSRGCVIKFLPASGTGTYDLGRIKSQIDTVFAVYNAKTEGFFMQSLFIQAGYFISAGPSVDKPRADALAADVIDIINYVNKKGAPIAWRSIQGCYNIWKDLFGRQFYLDGGGCL